ncbi:MAG: polysaccharide deacetylase family protein, partial [Burkholderiales bacterium]|nr:polysaccharide deacetylase family protein [Burkholderiales bacterium]
WPLGARALESGPEARATRVPILVYHRFAPTVLDSMTLRTARFESHLSTIKRLGCTVVPLADWVAYRRGERGPLPPRAVVLTADDGHRSQFEVMAPLLQREGWPVTLFIYPSAISNASYAMTWEQLRQLRTDPRVSIQSHTYWHPNLLRDRQTMSADVFERHARDQLRRSQEALNKRLDVSASLLAWPFGLSDPGLQQWAQESGYRAAFALENRSASRHDPLYAVPRHLMVDSVDAAQLAARLEAAFAQEDV